eukprot:804217-Amorphochlora_amoeboformis.AAC.1
MPTLFEHTIRHRSLIPKWADAQHADRVRQQRGGGGLGYECVRVRVMTRKAKIREKRGKSIWRGK